MITYTTPKCMICQTTTILRLPAEKLNRWASGELIQNVFPDLNPDVRELIKTGTHPECWDSMYLDD